MAEGASFDSQLQEHEPTCLPNTRVDVLQKIMSWVEDPNAERIFWLNGMAGTGKSTISRTISRSLSDTGKFGASFFFKKGEADRGVLSKLFTTIASDLLSWRPATIPHIRAALDDDPTIVTKTASEQFKRLVLEPLRRALADNKPTVIVIDALDECEPDDDIRLLIRLVAQFKPDASRGPIKFFLTSRPELPTRLEFRANKGSYGGLILHDVPESIIKNDLSALLQYQLANIRKDYNNWAEPDDQLDDEWPSTSDFGALVALSTPLFIAAVTICRFIGETRIATPRLQLAKVLSRNEDDASQLGRLYRPILENMIAGLSPSQETQVLREFRNIVGTIIVLANPLPSSTIATLLGISTDVMNGRLALLHSVLSVPSSIDAPIRVLHLSFRDFLAENDDPNMRFSIDEKQAHANLASKCLAALRSLRRNIANLNSPGERRPVLSLQPLDLVLPKVLQYACEYWPFHLEKAGSPIADDGEVHQFLREHFLHWIEALAILGKVFDSPALINRVQSVLSVSNTLLRRVHS